MTRKTVLLSGRGLVVLIIGIAYALAGCQKNSGPADTAEAAGLSAEYAAPAAEATVAGTSLRVTVSLDSALAKKAVPTDTVFVFARAAQGLRTPLAIVRLQVKDLPATVVLDDAHGMRPEKSLTSVPELVVVARVSRTGRASPRRGDLEGISGPVKLGQAVNINIEDVVTDP